MSGQKYRPIRIGRRQALDREIIFTLPLALLVGVMSIAFFDYNAAGSRGLVIASGGLAILLGVVARFAILEQRTLKLRLIPTGLRVTKSHRTTNWHELFIRNTDILKQGNILRLTTISEPKRMLELDLAEFNIRERIAIIEHLSQFLTPEQQAAHGKKWVERHTKLVSPPKPMKWLRPMVIFHLVCLSGLGLVMSFYGVVYFLMPLDFGPLAPGFFRSLMTIFCAHMVVFDVMFFIAWLDELRKRNEHREQLQTMGRSAR